MVKGLTSFKGEIQHTKPDGAVSPHYTAGLKYLEVLRLKCGLILVRFVLHIHIAQCLVVFTEVE